MKSKLVIILIAFIYTYIVFNESAFNKEKVLNYDKSGYYLYLPALFIYHDLTQVKFYKNVNLKHKLSPSFDDYGLTSLPNGNKVNKYAVGVSLLQLPFFFIGHIITFFTGYYDSDGYTKYYLLSLILSAVFYVVMGFIMLRNLLLNFFDDIVVAMVILIIGLGTNLYNYTAFDYCMSHPYSFFLLSAVLFYTSKFFLNKKPIFLIYAALFTGIVVITRPTNIIIVLPCIFWGCNNLKHLQERLFFYKINLINLIVAMFVFITVIFIQLSYWKYITGHWMYYSYGNEGFNFNNPQIINGLFSYRKGWFVYTPIALFAILGILIGLKKQLYTSIGILLFTCLNIYIVFSWHEWFYGGGFGARPLVESMSVLAFPLCILVKFIITQRKPWKIIGLTFLLFLTLLNIFQTYQFSMGIIPWDHNNKAYYWRVFGKLEKSDDDWKLINWNE